MDVLSLKGRSEKIFDADIANNTLDLNTFVSKPSSLFIGGASSIGQAVSNYTF